MSFGTIIHYVGSGLLLIAVILTIVVNCSAPVSDSITFANLNLDNDADVRFGVFGYCTKARNSNSWKCSDSTIGYNPGEIIEDMTNEESGRVRTAAMKALTRVLVLHPVGTIVTFVAFLLSLPASSAILSILSMLASVAALIINIIAVIIDFVLFAIIGNKLEDENVGSGKFGSAAYLALIAAIITLVATILLLFTCCSGRRQKKKERKMIDQQHAY